MPNETGFSPEEAIAQKMRLTKQTIEKGGSALEVVDTLRVEALKAQMEKSKEIFDKLLVAGEKNPAGKVVEIMGGTEQLADDARRELQILAEMVANLDQQDSKEEVASA